MVRRLFSVFTLLLFIVGCAPGAGQPIPAQSTEPAPPAKPTGATALTQLCKALFQKGAVPSTHSLAEAIEILVDERPSVAFDQIFASLPPEADCFRTTLSSVSTTPLGFATLINTGDQSAIIWRDGERWQVAPGPALGEYADIRSDRQTDGIREIIAFGHYSGTGGIGSVAVLQYREGSWQHQVLADRVSHFQGLILKNDTLLVTGRNLREEPLAWDANCCSPTNYQWLYQRKSGRFELTGERIVPDPYYTLNVFFGALQQRNTQWLNQVASPVAIEAALRLGLGHPTIQINTPNSAPDFGKVQEEERRHWDLLPAQLNKPKPSRTTLRVEVEILQGTIPAVIVNLKRVDGKWLVESLSGQPLPQLQEKSKR